MKEEDKGGEDKGKREVEKERGRGEKAAVQRLVQP